LAEALAQYLTRSRGSSSSADGGGREIVSWQ
jgi:hypothetical protein